MFVVRPQFHVAPGCGSSSVRGCRGGIRQPPKPLRRPQAKPRRQRRHVLRELAAGHVARRALRRHAEGDPAAHVDYEEDEAAEASAPAAGRGDHDSADVVSRLQARLVARRSSELAAMLARRHGEDWCDFVLQHPFRADEGMRRMCEAFALRPQLEKRVIAATMQRARGGSRRPGAAPAPTSTGAGCAAASAKGGSLRAEATAEAAGAAVPAAAAVATSASEDDWSSITLSGAGTEGEESASGAEAAGAGDRASTETAKFAGSREDCLSDRFRSARQPLWKTRALQSLGLEDSRAGAVAAGAAHDEASIDDEALLLSRLAAAVANAERQAAAAALSANGGAGSQRYCGRQQAVGSSMAERESDSESEEEDEESEDGSSEEEDEEGSGGCSPAYSSQLRTSARRPAGRRRVRLSAGSSIRFFLASDDADGASGDSVAIAGTGADESLKYERDLQTKTFDGPSGHKARRNFASPKLTAAPDPQATSTDGSGSDSSDTDDDEDDDEDWEEQCDGIAEVMGRQRHLFLWSASW